MPLDAHHQLGLVAQLLGSGSTPRSWFLGSARSAAGVVATAKNPPSQGSLRIEKKYCVAVGQRSPHGLSSDSEHVQMAVGQKAGIRNETNKNVHGIKDSNPRSPDGLILTHTHIPAEKEPRLKAPKVALYSAPSSARPVAKHSSPWHVNNHKTEASRSH